MDIVEKFIKSHQPRFVTFDNQKWEYLVGGKSNTAFLIFPGSGQDALSCFDLIGVFEKKYKAIAVNYQGFYSVETFFNYVNAILKKERVVKVVLYGLSLGGFLAQHFLRRYPYLVDELILSHTGSTKSKTIIRKVAIPGKILFTFLPILPQTLLNKLFKPVAGRVQSGNSDWMQLYKKYSSKENLEQRLDFANRSPFSMMNKIYLKSVYRLGLDLEKLEKKFSNSDLEKWQGKILIIRTDNDPLAQDDGMFKKYYPNAKVVTFHHTGHLTPFIQFEKMTDEIKRFLE